MHHQLWHLKRICIGRHFWGTPLANNTTEKSTEVQNDSQRIKDSKFLRARNSFPKSAPHGACCRDLEISSNSSLLLDKQFLD